MSQELLPPPYNDAEAPPTYDANVESQENESNPAAKRKILAYGCLIVSGAIANIIIWSLYYKQNN